MKPYLHHADPDLHFRYLDRYINMISGLRQISWSFFHSWPSQPLFWRTSCGDGACVCMEVVLRCIWGLQLHVRGSKCTRESLLVMYIGTGPFNKLWSCYTNAHKSPCMQSEFMWGVKYEIYVTPLCNLVSILTSANTITASTGGLCITLQIFWVRNLS